MPSDASSKAANSQRIDRSKSWPPRSPSEPAPQFSAAFMVCSCAAHERRRLEGKRQELAHGQRPTEIITLHFVAILGAQPLELVGGFHAFCDDGELEAVAQADDGPDDGGVARIRRQVPDEALIDLQPVHRK